MAEIKEVTKGKVYVLYFDPEIIDFDTLVADMHQIHESLPEGSKLLALPDYYKLKEESTEGLIEAKTMIEEILNSRQNNL
jgi:hypothetical protein